MFLLLLAIIPLTLLAVLIAVLRDSISLLLDYPVNWHSSTKENLRIGMSKGSTLKPSSQIRFSFRSLLGHSGYCISFLLGPDCIVVCDPPSRR
jgi:hypothetical protein